LSTTATSSSRRNSSKSSTFFVNPLSTKPSDSSRLARRFDTGSVDETGSEEETPLFSFEAVSPFPGPAGSECWPGDIPANIHKPTLRKLRTTTFLPNMVSPLHDEVNGWNFIG